MDPEMRRLLQNIAANTEENNVILKKLHRSMIWGRVFTTIYWVAILALAVGSFYLIQPYIEAAAGFFGIEFKSSGFVEFFQKFR
jgi:hypothetical protein